MLGALAEVLLYLAICLDQVCTFCRVRTACERIVYEEPAGWVWACPRCKSGYEDLLRQAERRRADRPRPPDLG